MVVLKRRARRKAKEEAKVKIEMRLKECVDRMTKNGVERKVTTDVPPREIQTAV